MGNNEQWFNQEELELYEKFMNNKHKEFMKDPKNAADFKRVIFKARPDFKEWIEQTSLFDAIKRHAGTGIIIEGLSDGLSIQLNGLGKVETAYDLPIEFIENFALNFPQ